MDHLSGAGPERPRSHTLAVFLVACCLFGSIAWARWEPYTFLHGDGAFYANIAKTLWRDHSLDQSHVHPRSWLVDDLGWNHDLDQGWSNVSLGKDGRWLPKHSWLLPLASLPLYGIFGLAGLLVMHVLMLAAIVAATYSLTARLAPPVVAAAATFLVASQPIISGDVYSYNNDVFYSALLLAGTAAFARAVGLGERAAPPWRVQRRALIVAGLAFGFGVFAKVTNIAYVLPFALWLIARWNPSAIMTALGAFTAPIGLFFASNTWLFGSPLTSSYSRILIRQDGLLTTESVSARFHEPLKAGLDRVLFDKAEGLLLKAPLVALSVVVALILGVLLWRRGATADRSAATDQAARRRGTLALSWTFLGVAAAFLALQAKYGFTYSRFFLPVAALGVAPLAVAFDGVARGLGMSRRILAPRYEGQYNPAFACAVLAAVAIALTVKARIFPSASGHFHALERLESGTVTAGGAPCDYFNNQHQKFECRGDQGRDSMWGRALDAQCSFQGKPRPLLLLHPKRGEQSLRFETPPLGALRFTYGLAETSRHDDVTFEVKLGDIPLPLPLVTRRDQLVVHVLEGLDGLPGPLTITLRGPKSDWRHFCFDVEEIE